MPAAEIAAAITGIRSALDITKAMVGLRDAEAFRSKSIELQGVVLDAFEKAIEAREAYAGQADRIRALEAEVTTLKAWGADRERYKLSEIRPDVTVIVLKDGMERGEPAHKLCPSCYQASFKSILQPQIWNPGRCSVLVCHDCGWHAYLTGASDPSHKSLKPKAYRGNE